MLRQNKDYLFSIVIPSFNEERYIVDLLKTLENQDFNADLFQVVVVDNNSTDKTAQVVWDFTFGSRLNINIVHEYKPGASLARNAGIRGAFGEYIVFLDADNTLDSQFLHDLHEYISRKDCLAGSIRTLPNVQSIRGWVVFSLLELFKLIFPRPFGKSFVKKTLLSECGGYNENIVLGENVEFLKKVKSLVIKKNGKFGHLRNGVKCSLRRFDKVGYFRILIPWFAAYLGNYAQKYKTMSEIECN